MKGPQEKRDVFEARDVASGLVPEAGQFSWIVITRENFVALEPKSRWIANAGDEGNVIEFAHHAFDPHPGNRVAAVQGGWYSVGIGLETFGSLIFLPLECQRGSRICIQRLAGFAYTG